MAHKHIMGHPKCVRKLVKGTILYREAAVDLDRGSLFFGKEGRGAK